MWETIGYLLRIHFKDVTFQSHYRSGRWLDAGCAKGFLLRIASQHGWEPYGFDVSPYVINEAMKVCPDAHLLVLDAQNPLPFPSEFFEVITACELIEHLTDPETFLREAHRLLKPGGLLFISTPNAKSIFSFQWVQNLCQTIEYTTPFDDDTHISYFSSKSISKTLKRCGFSRVETKHSWDLLRRVSVHLPSQLAWMSGRLLAFANR